MVISSAHRDVISRARGAFIGLAVGDALGAPVEFMTRGEIKDKYGVLKEMVGGGWLRLKPGQVTDDTEMSLCLARAAVKEGAWSLQAAANHLAGWLKSKPVDVGDTCRRGIRNYMLRGVLETPPNEWDGGNGAVMRTLPVALCTVGSDLLLERITLEQAHLTHNHPYSDAASISLGRLLHLALTGRSMLQLRREADQFIATHPSFTFDPYKGLATGYVVDTMQTVFHCFFRSRSFEGCIVDTVNQGGDADTTGAIAGALAGAYYGEEAIPSRWKKKLPRELVVEISALAEQLVCMSPLLQGMTGDERQP
ncbi:ADP-ribosyl-[dinitrogen reductase] hydrolase [Geomonas subterranea]|uniref:ADP-ribosyl-[dinitrogen reductase] hydrolase n=1 Tax=Geomonas subterranea TaxID=2847989 RepID=A0ABX8LK10_9BACT|nr:MULTISPECIES: ADP-ribosyl-[dinitrogen reductase] hydrolase [Geomonas]QXE92042.1 ADP-ribosyl-[dinitrogen reductase] hydrolase [Geomonas subterranea]QXM09865.1 ADP-ribosyl-[dinitrogen reductase] hydrolase [Geomonas subterranea]